MTEQNSELADLRAALELLAARWAEVAEGTERVATGPANAALAAVRVERARAHRAAAQSIFIVLSTGRLPHALMTSEELEQHATKEAGR